ncbi:cupin domain-containing protein [Roseomonas populi]|uniref:Cupin domain-containing protein n=1 Tax=Roseomonas populi TaxID=3121582 RepID=A0ABT1XBN5_9PROT|nr:cupin domain-containing protein [Roseomonas pecuniae]MCR0985527.1 cupin domain-containing protein [Roseomonas pecuniae]
MRSLAAGSAGIVLAAETGTAGAQPSPAGAPAILAPQLGGENVSAAPGRGLLPAVSVHVGAVPMLFGLDEQPMERMSPLIGRQYLSGAGATFCKWTMSKGAVVPLHHHANEQITWITQGRAEVFSQGRRFVMTAGALLIIPPNVPHEFLFTEDTIDIDIFTPQRQDWLDGTAGYYTR